MSYNAESLKEVAMYNKRDLKNKFFVISIKGVDYKFKVSGIGNRSIKIEKFFSDANTLVAEDDNQEII